MLTTILRRYQDYNPTSGEFDHKRGLREYGRLLGVSHATLSLIYSGQRDPSVEVLRAVAQAFPAAAPEIAAALAAPERESDRVTA
jgi:transcriptional regulator with XRE-family HTH domain